MVTDMGFVYLFIYCISQFDLTSPTRLIHKAGWLASYYLGSKVAKDALMNGLLSSNELTNKSMISIQVSTLTNTESYLPPVMMKANTSVTSRTDMPSLSLQEFFPLMLGLRFNA